MTSRALCLSATALFVALLCGLLASYPSETDVADVVVVPAFFAQEQTIAGIDASDLGVEASATEFDVETDTESDLFPLHEQARRDFREGRISRAIDKLSRLRREHPLNVAILNDLGVYYLSKSDDIRAEEVFREAIKANPAHARAHYNLGTLLFRKGRLEEAATSFTRALDSNPYYGEARYNRALVRTAAGDLEGAEQDYREVTRSDRSETAAKAYSNLAILLARQDRIGEAVAALRANLRLRPGDLSSRFNLAVILSRSGETEQAKQEYHRLLDLQPNHRNAALNLGALLMREEKWREARTIYDKAVLEHPGDAALLYNSGLCHARLGDDKAAAEDFGKAIEVDPGYAEAHYNLGLALKREKQLNEAIEHFAEAVKLRPGEASYHYNLALALSAGGREDEAAAEYRAALDLRPDYFRALYNLALLDYRNGRFEAARAGFEKALQSRPESYDATYNLGLTLLKLDLPAEAETVLRKALAFNETVEARYNLGLALARMGEKERAVSAYRAALQLNPKHARSIERLGETLTEIGRYKEALSRFVLLRKLDPSDPSAFNAGLALFRERNYQAALDYFEVSASGEAGVRRKSLNMKGASLAKLGKNGEAIAVYHEALEEFPADPSITRNLASALAQSGNHQAALDELEALRKSDGEDPRTLVLLGQERLALGQREAALRELGRALELDPKNEDALRLITQMKAVSD